MVVETFRKVISPGTINVDWRIMPIRVFVEIVWGEGRLVFSGVEGPYASGNAAGGSGQIDGHWDDGYLASMTFDPGWDLAMVTGLRDMWGRWHLNDMRAGTEAQMAWLRVNRTPAPLDQYEQDVADLTAAGLNPDPDTGYQYGVEWLHEDVPEDVLDWLRSLPDTRKQPAWI